MKTRITFVAENNAKIPEGIDREWMVKEIIKLWQKVLNELIVDPDETKATVENVEVFD